MKTSAAQAIADIVTDDELREDYIIPSVFNREVAPVVAAAVAEQARAERVGRGRFGGRVRVDRGVPGGLGRALRVARGAGGIVLARGAIRGWLGARKGVDDAGARPEIDEIAQRRPGSRARCRRSASARDRRNRAATVAVLGRARNVAARRDRRTARIAAIAAHQRGRVAGLSCSRPVLTDAMIGTRGRAAGRCAGVRRRIRRRTRAAELTAETEALLVVGHHLLPQPFQRRPGLGAPLETAGADAGPRDDAAPAVRRACRASPSTARPPSSPATPGPQRPPGHLPRPHPARLRRGRRTGPNAGAGVRHRAAAADRHDTDRSPMSCVARRADRAHRRSGAPEPRPRRDVHPQRGRGPAAGARSQRGPAGAAVNVRLRGYEVDALWPVQRVAVEVDSLEFHRSPSAFEHDRAKGAALAAAGLSVVRVTWHQLPL